MPRTGRSSLLVGLMGLVGLVGLIAGLALPFAPVLAERAEVSWPEPGRPAVSTTALLAPYRPAELTADVPCSALRAADQTGRPTTVLATGGSLAAAGGVLVRVDAGQALVLVNTRLVARAPVETQRDCGVRLGADRRGVTVTLAGTTRRLPGEPVPEVASFRTDLDAADTGGMTVRARTVDPFATSPTGLKTTLLVGQLLAAAAVLGLLGWRYGRRPTLRVPRPRPAWLVDGGVLGVLGAWAVIGPLSDDDGFATMIARNARLAGDQANYYRWWNASETPFALTQHLLTPLTEVSLAPLWLRLPSTVLGAAAWFALSRGVLGVVPGLGAGRVRVRALAAVCFLAGWLPYDLGVRPEPYVAFGLTALLALLYRARTTAGLGAATLVAALTMTASPSGVLVLAPLAMFAGPIVRILRAGARGGELAVRLALLAGVGAVALSVVFADQTLHGVLTATRWHTEFGPSYPWSSEYLRYRYLLADDHAANAAKRLPVLLAYAVLPVVAVALARRGGRDPRDGACARLAGVLVLGFALLWLTPSKWTIHFGALAGLLAAFLVVGTATLARYAREQPTHRPLDRTLLGTGLLGAVVVAAAAGLAFVGPNAWWQPVMYLVPWADGPVRPRGLPLDQPALWLAGLAVAVVVVRLRSGAVAARSVLAAAPGTLAVTAAAVSVALLLYSFGSAPARRAEGSLAAANLGRLGGGSGCGLADDIQVMPDVPGGVLAPDPAGGGPEELTGFAADAGFDPEHPPPQPAGVGASARVWGSRVDGDPAGTGRMVSAWFTLPALDPAQELAMTVSGRTDGGNRLALEFGRAGSGGTTPLGERTPLDRPRDDPAAPPDPAEWRSVWLPPAEIPAGADRVRVRAEDGSADSGGWLAFTGPRLREVVGLTGFLANRGPVLVNWPIAFLFPCADDVVGAAHGVVTAPRVVLEAPGRLKRLADVTTQSQVGGDFAALRTLAELAEVPSRVVGHPGLDWGSVRLVDYRVEATSLALGRYQLAVTRETVPGWTGDDAQFVTDGD